MRSWSACNLSQKPSLTPQYRERRKSVSAVTARFPSTISLMRRGGTASALASAVWLIPIGRRKSSISTSPGVGLCGSSTASMVVADFDILGAFVGPAEADPPLLVDPDRVLALPIARERLKPVSRRDSQVFQANRRVEKTKLSQGGVLYLGRKPSRSFAAPDRACFTV